MKKKARRKKFFPKFEPQYVKVIVEQDGIYRSMMITRINYSANGLEIIGRV